jgi:hypothetical protein
MQNNWLRIIVIIGLIVLAAVLAYNVLGGSSMR